ncbi:MAG: hypothetical protein NTY71_05115 [Methanoregula sp.]|jgi:hypothetical protein|nr:hypothetical protein [Methanoregula sp.]
MKATVCISILVITLACCAGCTGITVRDSPQGDLRAHYECAKSWSPAIGCYDQVSGYVYNAGTITVDNVVLHFNLVNTKTATIRDSKSVFAGSIGPGDSKTYETALDGECMEDYRVDFSFGT